MKNVFLGEYIKQRRLDLGLTQEQLCDGICEPVTLSRLENGKQTPSRNRINALLQRLGLPDDRYFALLSKNELEMEALQKEIVACNATEKVPEGFEKLAQFEKLADPDDQIAQQFALRSRVLLGRLDGRYTPLEQIDLLMQAIQLTVPRFDLESIETSVYKGYKRDKIEMRGDRAEMSDFPLYLNTVAGGLDRRDQTIGGFSFVVKIYAVPVVEIIG